MMKIGNIISAENAKEIEDLAYSMLQTFSQEYIRTYGSELVRLQDENDELEYNYTLSFCAWQRLKYPIKKGYLKKQGFVVKSWRKRYFVIKPDFTIEYFENEEAYEKKLKPKGTINPCGYKVIADIDSLLETRRKELSDLFGMECAASEKLPAYTFGIVHDKLRTFFITAENEEEKEEWVEMMKLCTECVKGLTINDATCQSTFNKAISRTLKSYGNPSHHKYKGTEIQIICDIISAEISSRFLTGIYRNVKGNYVHKMKVRDQVLKTLESSTLLLVNPTWKVLLEDKIKIRDKVEFLLREKKAEIATVRRKIEWEMNGKTKKYINEALSEVKTHAEKMSPILETSMVACLCEVRDIYQANIVEIAVDVSQREEVEIPTQMYIDSLDMLARSPAEMEVAYKHLEEMEKVLNEAEKELNTFHVATLMSEAKTKLRLVMDALINTFQKEFLERSKEIEGKQKHKELRDLIEDIDEGVADNLENDLNEIVNTYILKTLKEIFVPFLHRKVDSDCKMVIEQVDDVIPEHLRMVLTLDNEYERLVETSVVGVLKEIMEISGDKKQKSFASTMRTSRRKTFPRFSSRRTKFQSGYKRTENSSTKSLPAKSGTPAGKTPQRKTKLMNFSCLPMHADGRTLSLERDHDQEKDNMEEINLSINAENETTYKELNIR